MTKSETKQTYHPDPEVDAEMRAEAAADRAFDEAHGAAPACRHRLGSGEGMYWACELPEGHAGDHREGDVTWPCDRAPAPGTACWCDPPED